MVRRALLWGGEFDGESGSEPDGGPDNASPHQITGGMWNMSAVIPSCGLCKP